MINPKKYIKGIITNLAIFILILILYFSGLLASVETKTYDGRCRFSAKHLKCSDQISVVLLDQESLNWASNTKGWSWPWPREAYAEMINYFNQLNFLFIFYLIYV